MADLDLEAQRLLEKVEQNPGLLRRLVGVLWPALVTHVQSLIQAVAPAPPVNVNLAAPGPIGGTTPSPGSFTALVATGAGPDSSHQNTFPETNGKTYATTDQLAPEPIKLSLGAGVTQVVPGVSFSSGGTLCLAIIGADGTLDTPLQISFNTTTNKTQSGSTTARLSVTGSGPYGISVTNPFGQSATALITALETF